MVCAKVYSLVMHGLHRQIVVLDSRLDLAFHCSDALWYHSQGASGDMTHSGMDGRDLYCQDDGEKRGCGQSLRLHTAWDACALERRRQPRHAEPT